jgi:hypothetical protein
VSIKRSLLALPLAALLVASPLSSLATAGHLVVVVHPSNPVAVLSESDVMRLWMGKTRSFPDQVTAEPVSLRAGDGLRQRFETLVLNKSPNQVRAYWAQQIFTGRGTPPRELSTPADVRRFVASNPSAVGYLEPEMVDASVKVALEVR